MTRKDYQIIATMLGDIGREQDDAQFTAALDVAVRHLRGTNANFRADTFREWAAGVRSGKRDIDGRKR